MRVLVTRPREDADATAAKLTALGHDAIVAPLLEIRFREGPAISLDGVQAILATSANGVRAIARRTPRRDVALFAVGRQTADAARRAGFGAVQSADGDGAALTRAAARWAKRDGGSLLHAAGAETKGDLAAALVKDGFDLLTEVLYESVAVDTLPEAAADALRARALDAALFFSPRSAHVFSDLVRKAGLSCDVALAIAISPAAAKALDGLVFKEVRVAQSPDQDALLTLLD
ncbi:MAG TPA: uroporphyrinogen-III synthase [Rhizomicrobium sp.]|nr:uroporphyrinogen-III synthase [Rhizomicrobium sp.]